jgi:hypothetical protein
MAKDAKGHGSDSRGGSYPNIDKNLRGPGKHSGYSAAGDVWHIQKSNGPKSDWYTGVRQSNGDVISGKGLGAISQRLQADSDAWTKQALSSPAVGVAAQHGIDTSHLSGRQDMWGRTDADLEKDYGGPVRHFQKR